MFLDERPPTELLLGGSITVQTEGDLDFDADERDQQWENNEEEDDEGEGNECFSCVFQVTIIILFV